MVGAMSTETIAKRLNIIAELEDEINKVRAIYTEDLEDNSELAQVEEILAKAKEETKEKKAKVLSTAKFQDYEMQLKDLRSDLKEQREILSQELADYYRDSGKLEIKDPEGNTKRIKFAAKLVNT